MTELDELRDWKASAMTQLGKAEAIKELLPAEYLGWDVYGATVDYIKRLRSQGAVEGAGQWEAGRNAAVEYCLSHGWHHGSELAEELRKLQSPGGLASPPEGQKEGQ